MRPIPNRPAVLGVFAAVMIGLAPAIPAAAADSAPASPPDAAAVEKIVHDYLLKNPEVVVKALEAYKAKAQADEMAEQRRAIDSRRDEIFKDPLSAVGGNPDGDVTLVEFFDYRCGVCKRTHPVIEELVKRDGRIRMVYKEWPILGPDSVYASQAAIASRKQDAGKYVAFHNALMTARRVTRDSVLAIAAKTGLDTKRLERDMMAPEVEQIIKRNYSLAQALKINGTPSFIIGNTLLYGARDLETLRQVVSDARGKS